MDVKLIDTTLRDGEQETDVSFSPGDRERIIQGLEEAGIRCLEAGVALSGDRRFIRSLAGRNFTALCWCRARETDILAGLSLGTGALHISFPLSPLLLRQMGWDETRLFSTLELIFRRYRGECAYLSLGAMDAFRAEESLLERFVQAAAQMGADMIRLADTPGLADPPEVTRMFSRFPGLESRLEFHGHNDLGLAVANSLAAVQAGAGGVSGTLTGIGERAGNAPLEELALVLSLKAPERLGKGPDLPRLVRAARETAEILKEPVPRRKPLLGDHVFRHESGIHVRGLQADPAAFQAYPPALLGEKTDVLMGTSSGRWVVRLALEREGIPPDDRCLEEILSRIRRRAAEERRSFGLEEIRSFL